MMHKEEMLEAKMEGMMEWWKQLPEDKKKAVMKAKMEKKMKLVNPYIPGQAVKETKQIKQNPFSLYYLEPDDQYTDDQKNESQKATREFKRLWVQFVLDWRGLQEKHERLGASDTAARDAQVDWIKNHAVEVH
jgi:hypothetical protein